MEQKENLPSKKHSAPERIAAQTALRQLKSICRDPGQRAQDRIAAAKVLLEYGAACAPDEDSGLTVKIEGAPPDWLK